MRLVCPNCAAQYEIGENAIPAEGRDVQCATCSHVWFQEPVLKLGADDFLTPAGAGATAAAAAATTAASPSVSTPAPQEPIAQETPSEPVAPEPEVAPSAMFRSHRSEPQPVREEVRDILQSEAEFSSSRTKAPEPTIDTSDVSARISESLRDQAAATPVNEIVEPDVPQNVAPSDISESLRRISEPTTAEPTPEPATPEPIFTPQEPVVETPAVEAPAAPAEPTPSFVDATPVDPTPTEPIQVEPTPEPVPLMEQSEPISIEPTPTEQPAFVDPTPSPVVEQAPAVDPTPAADPTPTAAETDLTPITEFEAPSEAAPQEPAPQTTGFFNAPEPVTPTAEPEPELTPLVETPSEPELTPFNQVIQENAPSDEVAETPLRRVLTPQEPVAQEPVSEPLVTEQPAQPAPTFTRPIETAAVEPSAPVEPAPEPTQEINTPEPEISAEPDAGAAPFRRFGDAPAATVAPSQGDSDSELQLLRQRINNLDSGNAPETSAPVAEPAPEPEIDEGGLRGFTDGVLDPEPEVSEEPILKPFAPPTNEAAETTPQDDEDDLTPVGALLGGAAGATLGDKVEGAPLSAEAEERIETAGDDLQSVAALRAERAERAKNAKFGEPAGDAKPEPEQTAETTPDQAEEKPTLQRIQTIEETEEPVLRPASDLGDLAKGAAAGVAAGAAGLAASALQTEPAEQDLPEEPRLRRMDANSAEPEMGTGKSEKEGLPDVDELNTSLRMDKKSELKNMETDDEEVAPKKRGGFYRGVMAALLIFLLIMLVYLLAKPLSEMFPALAPYLGGLTNTVDAGLNSAGETANENSGVFDWIRSQWDNLVSSSEAL